VWPAALSKRDIVPSFRRVWPDGSTSLLRLVDVRLPCSRLDAASSEGLSARTPALRSAA
jgi:hypothetical protein